MTIEEKREYINEVANGYANNWIFLDTIDKSGKLSELYTKTRYSLAMTALDNEMILLINLLYKLIKKKEDDSTREI